MGAWRVGGLQRSSGRRPRQPRCFYRLEEALDLLGDHLAIRKLVERSDPPLGRGIHHSLATLEYMEYS